MSDYKGNPGHNHGHHRSQQDYHGNQGGPHYGHHGNQGYASQGPKAGWGPEPVQAQPPRYAQPSSSTTVVVAGNSKHGNRDWSSGICSCCSDCMSCCCVYWCGPFYSCYLATRMKENCCVGNPQCVPGGLIAMRTKLRVENNIAGSICGDCCYLTYCTPCAICQMARELNYLGTDGNSAQQTVVVATHHH